MIFMYLASGKSADKPKLGSNGGRGHVGKDRAPGSLLPVMSGEWEQGAALLPVLPHGVPGTTEVL